LRWGFYQGGRDGIGLEKGDHLPGNQRNERIIGGTSVIVKKPIGGFPRGNRLKILLPFNKLRGTVV